MGLIGGERRQEGKSGKLSHLAGDVSYLIHTQQPVDGQGRLEGIHPQGRVVAVRMNWLEQLDLVIGCGR